MRSCPNLKCGRRIPADSRICGYCRAPVSLEGWLRLLLVQGLAGGVRSLPCWGLAALIGGSAFAARSILATAVPGSVMYPAHISATRSAWAFAHFFLGIFTCVGWALLRHRHPLGALLNKDFARTSLGWGLVGAVVGTTRLTWYPLAAMDFVLQPLVKRIGGGPSWGLAGSVLGFTVAHAWAASAGRRPSARWKMVPTLALLLITMMQASDYGALRALSEGAADIARRVFGPNQSEPPVVSKADWSRGQFLVRTGDSWTLFQLPAPLEDTRRSGVSLTYAALQRSSTYHIYQGYDAYFFVQKGRIVAACSGNAALTTDTVQPGDSLVCERAESGEPRWWSTKGSRSRTRSLIGQPASVYTRAGDAAQSPGFDTMLVFARGNSLLYVGTDRGRVEVLGIEDSRAGYLLLKYYEPYLMEVRDDTPLKVNTSRLPVGQWATDYLALLAASGGNGDYEWALTSGSLPRTLHLTGSKIHGYCDEIGEFPLRLQVRDATGQVAYRDFVLEVSGPRILITTVNLPQGIVGEPYSAGLAARFSGPLRWSLSSGDLPSGLYLRDDQIRGIPSEAGAFSFSVRATAVTGLAAQKTLRLTVIRRPPPPPPDVPSRDPVGPTPASNGTGRRLPPPPP